MRGLAAPRSSGIAALAAEDRADEVGVHLHAQLVLAQVLSAAGASEPGVVDQPVELAEVRVDGREGRDHVGLASDIAGDGENLGLAVAFHQAFGRRLECVGAARDHAHARAAPQQGLADGQAEALGGAGDDVGLFAQGIAAGHRLNAGR